MGAMKNLEEFTTDKPNEIDELPHDALWSWIIIGITSWSACYSSSSRQWASGCNFLCIAAMPSLHASVRARAY